MLWAAPPEAADTRVKIEIRDPAGTVWSQTYGPLIAPDGPSTVEGHYLLDFPADMPRGRYKLWVAAGQEAPQLLTDIGVYNFTPPDNLEHPIQADFNHSIGLAGFDISTFTPTPGETIQIKFYWHALQPLAHDYTNFVHLIDTGGRPVVQIDITPGGGSAPTTAWQPNEWLTDNIQLNLPADLPPGKYDLLLGWYYWETMERLPLIDQENDYLYLTSIEVK